jgi:hypothetical protein
MSDDRLDALNEFDEIEPNPVVFTAAAPRSNGTAPGVIGSVIEDGRRNCTLTSLAGSMRRRGATPEAIVAALRIDNTTRCRPPLEDDEVARIAASVGRYTPAPEPSDDARATAFRLQVMTARALCDLPDPPDEDQLLGPLVVRGQRVIIGAHTGEGKTSLTLQVIAATVNRSAFLDWRGAGSRALVLDLEQGQRTVKRRLREAGLDANDRVDYVRVPDGLSLDKNAAHIAEVERLLAAGGYDVVAVDPLYKLHTGDANDERSAIDIMRRLDAWRDQYRFALVMPVHCRKPLPGTKFSIHDLFGSSAYTRGAEVVLGLRRVGDGYAKLHFLKDRDGDLPIGAAWGLLFNRDTLFTRDPNDGRRDTAADKVSAMLADDPLLTNEQVATATGVSIRTVQRVRKTIDPDAAQHSLTDELAT